MRNDTPPEYTGVRALATKWACSTAKIYRMINSGDLPATRIRTMIRIPLAAIHEIENQTACPKQESPASVASQDETHGTSITSANASLRAARIARRLN